MHIALLGAGKTGGKVAELAGEQDDTRVTVFDIDNPPTVQAMRAHDVVISFLPGPPFAALIEDLLQLDIPVISGSTGFDWPDGREAFSQKLSGLGRTWVHANNFSIGMNIVHELIRIISMADQLYGQCSFHMHEVHHVHKKDAPSGTALAWEKWLAKPVEITSERTGDVVGAHTLTLKTPFEEITVAHSAKDRRLFAAGALWTAREVLAQNASMKPGLYDIQQIALKKLWAETRAPE